MALMWVVLQVAVVGCSSAGGGGSASGSASASPGGALDLASVCPATVVLQTDWQPEAEYGTFYNLVGDGYTLDRAKKSLKGPLVSQGRSTGVDLEIRTGGAAISFQPVSAAMYADKSITIGQVATDEAVHFSAKLPTTAVLAPLDISPLGLMWDPATYPNVKTIADIGKSGAKVLYYQSGGAYPIDYLVGTGVLHKGQLDGSYDGSPAAFVAAGGKAAQQGFATAEPYIYQHEVKAWGKPSNFALYHDAGYPSYIGALSMRSGDKEKLSPCLKRLVPIIQQSQVDYMRSPDRAIGIILAAVKAYNTGWVYGDALAHNAVAKMTELKLMGNGPNSTVGDFDLQRVQRTIDIVSPILAAEGTPAKSGLTAGDIATNEFINPAIGLPR
ncbi:hypothetical protein ACWCQZ_48960 [Streptomyces sp. NPDC002285]